MTYTYKQIVEGGMMADLSGITNPHVFKWERKTNTEVYYPVDFNLLSILVYKFPLSDATNGGVSGGDTESIYIPCPDGPYRALSPYVDQRLILIPEQRSKDYWSLKDVNVQPGMIGPMSGGNLAYSSDSRCRYVYHIHDRFETSDTYRALSI